MFAPTWAHDAGIEIRLALRQRTRPDSASLDREYTSRAEDTPATARDNAPKARCPCQLPSCLRWPRGCSGIESSWLAAGKSAAVAETEQDGTESVALGRDQWLGEAVESGGSEQDAVDLGGRARSGNAASFACYWHS